MILLFQSSNSLGPEALFVTDTTVFTKQRLRTKVFEEQHSQGVADPRTLLLAHPQTDTICVISYIVKILIFPPDLAK